MKYPRCGVVYWFVSRVVSTTPVLAFAIATLGLAACGGGGGDGSAAATATGGNIATGGGSAAPAGNRAPTIAGVPAATLAAGVRYSFTPTAADADGEFLAFSIANMPPWATFAPSTGALRGTPAAADIGKYSNVTISVTDGTHTVSLPPFSVEVLATATGSITLSWYPPTEREDGSPLDRLGGYKFYWGTSQGDYPNFVSIAHSGIASYVIDNLTPGTYYLVATAFDAAGLESDFSNVISQVVR